MTPEEREAVIIELERLIEQHQQLFDQTGDATLLLYIRRLESALKQLKQE